MLMRILCFNDFRPKSILERENKLFAMLLMLMSNGHVRIE